MKLNYTFNTLLWISKAKLKNGVAPIYLRLTVDGKRTEIATKKLVPIEQWSSETQCVKGHNEEVRKMNKDLSILVEKAVKIHEQISELDRIPTPREIKVALLTTDKRPKHKTICQAFDYHNLKMAETASAGLVSKKTLVRYQITKNKVISFMSTTLGAEDKPLPELRLSFITEFEHFLLTKQRIQSNTAHKYIKPMC